MQFKVLSALFFATLAAAATVPGSNTNPGPGNTNSGNTDPAKTSTNPTTGTKPGNTNGGTNQNTSMIKPPFPATSGGAPPTISASKCTAGHLRCCKSSGLPTDPTVVAHLPSGVSKDSFSGYAGIDCVKLPDGALPNTCTYKPLCCTDIDHSIGCNPATLGL